MKLGAGRGVVLRMISGSVAIQAMLSASSFAVGLLMVRRTSDAQYGYYVLITSAIMLVTTLQWSFIGPPMIIRLTGADRPQRSNLIGGIYRDQQRLLPMLAGLMLLLALVLKISGRIDFPLAAALVAGAAAAIASLHREFLRTVLFAYQRPNGVLRSDSVYCLFLVAGAYFSTFSPMPAATAALTMTLACVFGAALLSKELWQHEPWNPKAPLGMLKEFAPMGGFSAFGAGVHWLFSQGYNYLVAGTLDISAVAALAATRLMVMPVNLLSTGLGNLMLPSVSRWNRTLDPMAVFLRLVLVSVGLAGLACCYLVVMWLARNWIFDDVLKKNLPERNLLLLLWCAISIVTVFRDQLLHFLVARARFRTTSSLTLISATFATVCSLLAMPHFGAPGALIGLLTGELTNAIGLVVLSIREAKLARISASVADMS